MKATDKRLAVHGRVERWSFTADPDGVRRARQASRECAMRARCGEEAVWAVALSVTEAVTNAALHAFVDGREADRRVEVTVDCGSEAQLLVEVVDNGVGMRQRSDSPGAGYGLQLIAASAQQVAFESPPSGGLVVRMRFKR